MMGEIFSKKKKVLLFLVFPLIFLFTSFFLLNALPVGVEVNPVRDVTISMTGNLTQLGQLTDVTIPSPNDGEALTFNSTTGVWESIAVSVVLNNIGNPTDNTSINLANKVIEWIFTTPATEAFAIEGSGAFSGDLVHIHQHTGNPTATNLVHLHADDADVLPLLIMGANPIAINISTKGNISIANGRLLASNWGNVTPIINSTTTIFNSTMKAYVDAQGPFRGLTNFTFEGDSFINGNLNVTSDLNFTQGFVGLTAGACDVGTSGSICRNSTGMYIVG